MKKVVLLEVLKIIKLFLRIEVLLKVLKVRKLFLKIVSIFHADKSNSYSKFIKKVFLEGERFLLKVVSLMCLVVG